MSKIISIEEIKKALSKRCACYVLITCTEPNEQGQMDVELDYEGDETLASFLVENAGQVFDRRAEQRETN